MICVKKFGGTSLGSTDRIQRVADRILADQAKGQRTVLVVSAMSGETNRLVGLVDQVSEGNRGPFYDLAVATGEQVSVALVALAIEKSGGKARPYLGLHLPLQTDSSYGRARILDIGTKNLFDNVEKGVVPVIAGFQGVDEHGCITTLGRGGSDTSAVAVAAAMKLGSCEIYTDVPAVFTADPRLVPAAREIKKLSFEEMMEMASLGSKVLHIRSVELGANWNVRIHVRSSFESREGTWVVPEGEVMESAVVASVTHELSTSIVEIEPIPKGTEFLAELFESLAEKNIVVDVISQNETAQGQRLAFSVPAEDRHLARDIAKTRLPKATITIRDEVSKVSIIGTGMKNHTGVAARFFRTLQSKNIRVHLVTTSEIKISAIIDRERLSEAAQALHTGFGLDGIVKGANAPGGRGP